MGINAMSLVMFSGLHLLLLGLNRCRERIVMNVLRVLWVLLLGGNLFRYLYVYPFVVGEVHIPIEYSTVGYFLVPVLMFWNIKNSRVWGAAYGLIAGLMYYLTMIVAGGSLYSDAPPYDVYISYFCHGVLYLNGMLVIRRKHVTDRDWAKMMLCLLIVSVRSLALRRFAVDADELFIYDVLMGNVIRMVLPEKYWGFMVPLYYVALNLFIVFSLRGFFPNRGHRRKKVRPEQG